MLSSRRVAGADSHTLGLCRVALRVRDLRVMEGFYVGLLGFAVEWRPDEATLRLSLGSARLWLAQSEAIAPRGALLHLGLGYPRPGDVEALCRKLEGAGVRIVEPAQQLPDGTYAALVVDPEGNGVQLFCESTASRR